MESIMSDKLPELIGKYKIQGLIAKGGMGAVYKTVHPTLKTPLVIKKLTSCRNSTNEKRFEQEAKMMMTVLRNPYIVGVYDHFKEGSFRYFVEEYVDGMALDKVIEKQKKLSPQLSMLILKDVCIALNFAHSKGIIHRDIKPGNVLISKQAAIKLTDFGIASNQNEKQYVEVEPKHSRTSLKISKKAAKGDKTVASDATVVNADATAALTSLTQANVSMGTPSYMPPEQFLDSSTVTPAADIYALGVMLYEMLTGEKPFKESDSLQGMFNEKLKGKYISPGKINPEVPLSICLLIRRMLTPNKKWRIQKVSRILNFVRRYLNKWDVETAEHQKKRLRKEAVQLAKKHGKKIAKEPKEKKEKESSVGKQDSEHNNLYRIRVQLARIVNSKTEIAVKEAMFLKKNRYLKRILIAVLCASALCATFVLCWQTKLIHKYILRPFISPVTIELEMPATSSANPDQPIIAMIFEDDGESFPEVKDARSTLVPVSMSNGKNKTRTFKADNIYLKPGKYRLKVATGPFVWWDNFVVEEESLKKAFSNEKQHVYIHGDFLKNVTKKISVHPYVFNSRTGNQLKIRENPEDDTKGLAKIKVMNFNKYLDDPELPEMSAGNVWIFQVECEGYKKETYRLMLDWYQDELILYAVLTPID